MCNQDAVLATAYESLDSARKLGDRRAEAAALTHIGNLLQMQSSRSIFSVRDPSEPPTTWGISSFFEAIEIYLALGETTKVAQLYSRIADIYEAVGEVHEAAIARERSGVYEI